MLEDKYVNCIKKCVGNEHFHDPNYIENHMTTRYICASNICAMKNSVT
jgi:hypothetical protein